MTGSDADSRGSAADARSFAADARGFAADARGFAADARGFAADVLTLYPEMFPGPLGLSLSGKALANGLWSLAVTDYRDFAEGRHRSVDDTPAGGGPGMVMRADVVARALDAVSPAGDARPRLLMSPRGRPLDQAFVRAIAEGSGAVILCGRFEGVDERVIEARGLTEVSIGDYVLSGGELAAMVALDAVVRLLPGVMGKPESGTEESFEAGLLEYPHYTRPVDWEGRTIPPVLVSGDHARIARWRREAAERLTAERRPDLYTAYAARRGAEDESKPQKRGPRRDDGGMTSGRTSSIRNANFEDR